MGQRRLLRLQRLFWHWQRARVGGDCERNLRQYMAGLQIRRARRDMAAEWIYGPQVHRPRISRLPPHRRRAQDCAVMIDEHRDTVASWGLRLAEYRRTSTCPACGVSVGHLLNGRVYCNLYCQVMARVRVGDPDDCWEWFGPRNRAGYGVISIKCGYHLAHRALASVVIGEPGDRNVMHTCDNPPCCNPAHLRVASFADNMADMSQKRRHGSITKPHRVACGVRHGNAKLTDAKVLLIRSGAISNGEATKAFGVHETTIINAKYGATWRHVRDPGREVPTPAILLNRPRLPPGRR